MAQITNIKAGATIFNFDWKEIWAYRELFQTLALRDIKVKYKQTVIGITWAVIQPFMQMVVFSFFFGKLAKMPSENVPYPLFSFSGLILWTMFTTALTNASNSMVGSAHLISKVYFPRVIVPIAATLVAYLDYLISWTVLTLLFGLFKWIPSWTIIVSPLVALGVLSMANGIGFLLSAVNVQFRDVRYALPFFIQLLIFVSPVIYPASVAGQFEWLVKLNPMTGYLELHRMVILGHQHIDLHAVLYSVVATLSMLIIGFLYFNWQQKKFADII